MSSSGVVAFPISTGNEDLSFIKCKVTPNKFVGVKTFSLGEFAFAG